MKRVVIIGGGITGLSAAWTLLQSASSLEIILLEKSERLGGCIETEHADGFLMENGPDVFLARKPEAAQLCTSLGLPVQKTNESHRGVYLRRGQRLFRVPEGMSALVPGRIGPLFRSPLLSFSGKLRVLSELVVPALRDGSDESVADFFTRRFGREAFKILIEPLLGGLAGGQADILSIRALMPHVRNLELKYGSILLGVDRTSVSPTLSSLQSLSNGMSSLISALAARMPDNIRLGHKVTEITRDKTQWKVHLSGHSPLSATDIVLAVPAWSASIMMEPVNQKLASLLRSIPYRAGTMVHLAYLEKDIPRPMSGYGHLVHTDESGSVAACTWSSIKLSGRAPAGHALFRIYLRAGELTDSIILEHSFSEMRSALGVTAAPLLTRIRRFPAALPQYTLGHMDRIERIHQVISSCSGLCLAGNYLDGVGISDCIRNGTLAANQVLHRHA